jgi:flagellar motor switch protein FliM
MPDILSEKEQVRLLLNQLDKPGDQMDVGAALGVVQGLPPLAARLMDKCRAPDQGFTGSTMEQAVEFLGPQLWQQLARQAVDEMCQEGVLSSPAPESGITSYDFCHPARINKDQFRTLENLHDNFARLLSSTLSGAMRAVVDVDTAFVDQTTYGEFIRSLSSPSCSYQFTLRPTGGQAIIDIAMPLVFSAVDRIFGGKGSSQGVQARQVTPIEIGIINRITKRIIEDLEATWEPVKRVDVTDIELETNPEFMQITAASEIVILLAFEVNSTNASGLISLCYPFFTLEPVLPLLGTLAYVRSKPKQNREPLRRDNRLRLGSMEVDMVAELGRTRISLEEARSLQAGDVLRLPKRQSDPLRVYLGGKPKYLAHPFATDSDEIQLKVVGRVEE